MLGVLIHSCTKEPLLSSNYYSTLDDKPYVKNDEIQYSISSDCWNNPLNCSINNLNNPYDSVGIMHNEILCTVGSETDSSTTLDKYYEIVDSILEDWYGTVWETGYSGEKFSEEVLDAIVDDSLDTFLDSLSISKVERNAVYSLLQVIEDYDSTNICTIISDIIALEDSLITEYGSANIQDFLMCSSVARYSMAFWDGKIDFSESGLRLFGRKFWKKLFIGVADVVGGLAGGSAGAPTTVGIIAGAITGASVTSVGAGKLWDLWDNDDGNGGGGSPQ